MPRAFLITNKRYNSNEEQDIGTQARPAIYACREESPERRVSTAEEPISECAIKSSLTREDNARRLQEHIKPASPKSPASLSRAPGLLTDLHDACTMPATYSYHRDEPEQLQPLGLIVPKSRGADHLTATNAPPSEPTIPLDPPPRSGVANPNGIRYTSVIRNLSSQFRALARSHPVPPYPTAVSNAAIHHLPATLSAASSPHHSQHQGRVPAATLFHGRHSTPGNQNPATAYVVSSGGAGGTSHQSRRQIAATAPGSEQFASDTSNESSGSNSDSGNSSASSSGQDAHVCPECGKRYSTSSNLARHRQTHRSVTDKKARKCPHCDKVYVSIPAYSMHVRTHSQGCQCPYCGKCFSRPWLLQGHIRTHTGEKPFKCPICAKAFADKSNLRAHVQTHSTTKPYVCQRCGKAFALKSYLYKHEESSCMRLHRQHHRNAAVASPAPPASALPLTLQIQA